MRYETFLKHLNEIKNPKMGWLSIQNLEIKIHKSTAPL